MEIKYQGYWASEKLFQTEEDTIDNLDLINDTKYLRLFKKGEITVEEIAHKNHNDGLLYEVTILEDDRPINFLEITHKNNFIGVQFIDEEGRNYLTYHFKEIESKKVVFLREVWYYYFPNEEATNEDYRLHFVFDQEGNAAYRKYDEINKKTIDYETKEPLNVSGLYESYPEFGKYEGLIKVERKMELLDNIKNVE